MEENVVNTTVNTNFTSSVTDTFNHIFRTLLLSIDDTIYSLLDELALALTDDELLENMEYIARMEDIELEGE